MYLNCRFEVPVLGNAKNDNFFTRDRHEPAH